MAHSFDKYKTKFRCTKFHILYLLSILIKLTDGAHSRIKSTSSIIGVMINYDSTAVTTIIPSIERLLIVVQPINSYIRLLTIHLKLPLTVQVHT